MDDVKVETINCGDVRAELTRLKLWSPSRTGSRANSTVRATPAS